MNAAAQVRAQLAEAGVRGWVHARPVGGGDNGPEVAVDADAEVVMASVYKLPVLVAFCRSVDAGLLDPREPVELDPATRTRGGTGISVMSDPVTMSWRDLARSMITVSDDAAGDTLLDRIGLDRVQSTLTDIGVVHTRVTGGSRDTHQLLTHDTGALDVGAAIEMMSDNDHPTTSRVLDPLLATSTTTARDMTSLLSRIWDDTAASPEQSLFMRAVLSQQIWPHRLRSGFPYPGVLVAGKTGTLGPLRHEVGVVHHQHESPVAVAVLTHAARADRYLPGVDAAIGATARTAVFALR